MTQEEADNALVSLKEEAKRIKGAMGFESVVIVAVAIDDDNEKVCMVGYSGSEFKTIGMLHDHD